MVRYWMSLLLGVAGAIGVGVNGAIAQLNLIPDTAPGRSLGTMIIPIAGHK
jgi:hypothetical protein